MTAITSTSIGYLGELEGGSLHAWLARLTRRD